MDTATIQRYNHTKQALEKPLSHKVKKLIELGLVRKVTDGVYECLPIPGYNITTYTIRETMGKLVCNCQAGRKGRECSHIQAVRLFKEKTENTKEQQLYI